MSAPPEPPDAADDDIEDWDVTIEMPPPVQQGSIDVTLIYTGRSQPLPLEDDA